MANSKKKKYTKPAIVLLGNADAAIENLIKAGKFEHAAAVKGMRIASKAEVPGPDDGASDAPKS